MMVAYLLEKGYDIDLENSKLVDAIEKSFDTDPTEEYQRCFPLEEFAFDKYTLKDVEKIKCKGCPFTARIVMGYIRDEETGLYFKSSTSWVTFAMRMHKNDASQKSKYSGPERCIFEMNDGVLIPYARWKSQRPLEIMETDKNENDKRVREPKLSKAVIEAIKDIFFDGCNISECPKCNRSILRDRAEYHISHIMNFPNKAIHELWNLFLLCTDCNLRDSRYRNEFDMIAMKNMAGGKKIYQTLVKLYTALHKKEPDDPRDVLCFLMERFVSVSLGGGREECGIENPSTIDAVKTEAYHIAQEQYLASRRDIEIRKRFIESEIKACEDRYGAILLELTPSS